MSKQPKEISIDWPPVSGRKVEYLERTELDYIIPLTNNYKKEIEDNTK